MNAVPSRAERIAEAKRLQLAAMEDDLRLLIDNPDESALTAEGEQYLQAALTHLAQAQQQLAKMVAVQ